MSKPKEPTLQDVLTAVNALARDVQQLTGRVAALEAKKCPSVDLSPTTTALRDINLLCLQIKKAVVGNA